MTAPTGPDGDAAQDAVARLFDELCLRWAREADVVVQQNGALAPTLVLLPRDRTADEVAMRLDGLRGNLAERGDALVAELRPQTDPHDPAGLVLMLEARLGVEQGPSGAGAQHVHSGHGTDGVVVYVTLGHPQLRRALGFRVHRVVEGPPTLVRADDDPPVEHFRWLDTLLQRRGDQPG